MIIRCRLCNHVGEAWGAPHRMWCCSKCTAVFRFADQFTKLVYSVRDARALYNAVHGRLGIFSCKKILADADSWQDIEKVLDKYAPGAVRWWDEGD